MGSNLPRKVDVRIVAATNVNLEERIAQGKFRQDLYYRLNVITLHIPSLSERTEDIPLLVEHFLQKFNDEFGLDVSRIHPMVIEVFEKFGQVMSGN